MKKINVVIFDLDGTLLDTLDDLRDSLNHVLSLNNKKEHSLAEVRSYVGNGIDKLVERALENGRADEAFDVILKEFSEHYAQNSATKTKPYDGICELLEKLSREGFKLAIVSNKPDSAVKALNCRYFGELVPVAIGESASVERKPAPDTVLAALKQLDSAVDNAVFVGDSEVDIQTAKNAGITCISVDWGFKTAEYLNANGASTVVENTTELYEAIHSLDKTAC